MPIENVRSFDSDRSIMAQEKARAEKAEEYSAQSQYFDKADGDSENPERDLSSYSIEELGQMFQSTTEQTYRILERRESIRQTLIHKIVVAQEMLSATSEKFDSRTGLDRPREMLMRSEGIDHRERL